MVTKEQLDLSKKIWEQAKERAALTNEAMGRLKISKDVLIDSLKRLGSSHNAAREEFEKHLDAHWDELGKATREVNRTEEIYAELYKKYKSQQKTP